MGFKTKHEPCMQAGDKLFIGIGGRIKYLRGNESLVSFSKKLGVHKNTLARYEKEESLPDVGFVSTLCEIIDDEDVTPNWLINGEGFPPGPAYSLAHEEFRDRISSLGNIEKATKAITDHRLNISPHNLVDYVKGDYLPTDKELEELATAYMYDSDLLLSKRKPREHVEGVDEKKITYRLFNAEILREVLLAVEGCIADNDLLLTPEKKFELIAIIYEEIYDEKLKWNALQERVSRLLKLAT